MIEEDRAIVAAWGKKLKREVAIDLALTGDERSGRFYDFCSRLTSLAPSVRVRSETHDDDGPPTIRVGNVLYRAIPGDRELKPFLEVLADRDGLVRHLGEPVREQLGRIRIPAPLKVYIAPHCPFCPTTVKLLLGLAAASDFIKLTVIDGVLFPELAGSDKVRSAPTVLLDGQYRWTGSIQLAEVVGMLLNRDPSRLSAASIEDMFKEGEAAAVAEMMIAEKKIFPAFLDLLVHEKWPVRLGAMVTFETIVDTDRELAARCAPFLWGRFSTAVDTVKGDILYLLGKSGDQKYAENLESVLNGPYSDDLKEAAADALEEIRQNRNG